MSFNPHPPRPQPSPSRKRWRDGALILGILALLVFLARFENHLYDLTQKFPLSNSVLILALINLNILLIILFLFLVFRNLLKFYLERRKGVPGSRLRVKLVMTFVALSLIPTLLLYFVSAAFITNSIENWFNAQIESSLQESLEVAQTYYQNSATNALYYGEQLARIIKDEKLLNDENLPRLSAVVSQKQQEYNLGIVEVFSSTNEELVRAINPHVPTTDFTNPDSENIHEALSGKHVSRITSLGKADLIRGIVPIYSNWNPQDVVGVVVVNYYVPYSLVHKMQEISNSFDQFKNTKLLKGRIKKGYLVFLALIALVIIFLATWFGFHLARGITGPIQKLALATNRVAEGDLDVSIDVQSDDEIGLLVAAFNKMTGDLRRNQQEIDQANRDLRTSNLELDQRRRYMEIVLKNVTAGVVSVDKQGNLTTVNKSAEKLLRIKPGKVLGKHFREVVSSEHLPMIREILLELRDSGKDSIRRQITLPLADDKLTLLVNVATLRDEQGEFMGTVVVFDDLTQLTQSTAHGRLARSGKAHRP